MQKKEGAMIKIKIRAKFNPMIALNKMGSVKIIKPLMKKSICVKYPVRPNITMYKEQTGTPSRLMPFTNLIFSAMASE